MRTASIDQSTPASTPKVVVVVNEDIHTSEGGGGNNKLSKVYTDEMPWGGQYVVELDNSDEALNAKDYEGETLALNMTFVGETADSYSPLWVHSQQFSSKEGKLLLNLNCVDIWTLIAAHNAALANASYNQKWQTEAELSTRYLPDGVTLLSDGASDLYDALLANGDKTIWAIIQDLAAAAGVTVSLDDDDGYVNALKPPRSVSNARSGMRQVMDMTECYLKWKTNGVLGVYWPANHATVYSFNTADLTFSNVEEVGVTIPNRIIFWAYHPDGDAWLHSDYDGGHGVDAASYAKLGQYVDRHYLLADMTNENVKSQADLDALADGTLEKVQAERNQGFFIAPMHVSLELFDKVEVVDSRYDTPKTITGYIHRIIREYDRGIYRIAVYLGGVAGGYTPPGGADVKGLADSPPPVAPLSPWDLKFAPAYLPAVIDIVFSAVDHDTVEWDSGTIKTADGSVWNVSSGSKELDNANVFYAYYDVNADTGVLEWTQTFGNTISHERILVGFFKAASAGDDALIVIGSQGKGLFIDKLSAITADMGLLTAGEIRVGTGTLGVDFTGFRHWVEAGVGHIAGYLNDAIQWYSGSDGKLYAGAGDVQLDENGLLIDCTDITTRLTFKYSAKVANLFLTGTYLVVEPSVSTGILLYAYGGARMQVAAEGLLPWGNNQYNLGNTTYAWKGGYFASRLKIPVGTDMYD